MTTKANRPPLASIVHYIVARTEPCELGATKLNKVLWLVDQIAWRETGQVLSDVESYRRLPHGPVPTEIVRAVNLLKNEGKIVELSAHTPVGMRREFKSLEDPPLDEFSAYDLDVITRSLTFITPISARRVSDLTHDAYWDEVPNGAEMFVDAGAVWLKPVDSEALEWAYSELTEK